MVPKLCDQVPPGNYGELRKAKGYFNFHGKCNDAIHMMTLTEELLLSTAVSTLDQVSLSSMS